MAMDPAHTTLSPGIQQMDVDEHPKRKKRAMNKSNKTPKKLRLTSIILLITIFLICLLAPQRKNCTSFSLNTKTQADKDELEEIEEETSLRVSTSNKPPIDGRKSNAFASLDRSADEEKQGDGSKNKKREASKKPAQALIVELKGWSQSAHVHQTPTHLIKYIELALSEKSIRKLNALDYEAMKALLDRPDAPAWISADGGSRVLLALTLEQEPLELMKVRDDVTMAMPATGFWNLFMLDLCRLLAITDCSKVVMVIVGTGGLTLSRFVSNSHNQCRGSLGITFDVAERYGIDTSEPGAVANLDASQTKILQVGASRNEPRRLSVQMPPRSIVRFARFPSAFFMEAIRGKSFDVRFETTTLWIFKKRRAPSVEDRIDSLLE